MRVELLVLNLLEFVVVGFNFKTWYQELLEFLLLYIYIYIYRNKDCCKQNVAKI